MRRFLVILLTLLPLAATAEPAGFVDGTRYVFVTAEASSRLTVIDSGDDSVAGQLDAGLVPAQLEASAAAGRLAAIDGVTPRLALVPMSGGGPQVVALPFVPSLLIMDGGGGVAVAADPAAGRLAVVEVASGRLAVHSATLPRFRDLLADGERQLLYVAPHDGDGVLAFRLADLRPAGSIAADGAVAVLSRTPGGRVAYGRSSGGAELAAFDLGGGRQSGRVAVGTGMARAYTNATGITVILPDNGLRAVTFATPALRARATLAAAAGMNGVYSGWFDTVAFIPSTAARAVLVFDQQELQRGVDIPLGAIPGRGTVTPDGRKLYLPLVDGGGVAVIDAESRRLAGTIHTGGRPRIALMARTFGICH